jgi:hypothetical protein
MKAGNVIETHKARGTVQTMVRFSSHHIAVSAKREFPWNQVKFSAQPRRLPLRLPDLLAWWSFSGANQCMSGRQSTSFGFDFS